MSKTDCSLCLIYFSSLSDYVTNVLVEQFLKGGQPISRSPLPVVPTSQAAAASESMVTVPTNQEKPLPGGADGISRRHLQGDGQDISTQLSIGKVNLPPNEVRLQQRESE